MKKLSKKGVLLLAGVMALCAFVMPSMASAASWGVVGSEHTLDSPNLAFTNTTAIGALTSQCTRSSFTANVSSAQNLEITSASFGGLCTASGGAGVGDCTLTAVGTRFPWTATATTTANIQIHGVFIDLTFEDLPGQASTVCPNLRNQSLTLTGTLTGGRWTGNGAHRALDFSNAEGLVTHGALGNGLPITVRGFVTDTQNTLIVTG
jgi:hypothetical protein